MAGHFPKVARTSQPVLSSTGVPTDHPRTVFSGAICCGEHREVIRSVRHAEASTTLGATSTTSAGVFGWERLQPGPGQDRRRRVSKCIGTSVVDFGQLFFVGGEFGQFRLRPFRFRPAGRSRIGRSRIGRSRAFSLERHYSAVAFSSDSAHCLLWSWVKRLAMASLADVVFVPPTWEELSRLRTVSPTSPVGWQAAAGRALSDVEGALLRGPANAILSTSLPITGRRVLSWGLGRRVPSRKRCGENATRVGGSKSMSLTSALWTSSTHGGSRLW